MKKILSGLFAILICLSLCACAKPNNKHQSSDTSEIANTETKDTETDDTTVNNFEPEINSVWLSDATVDDFGDITENSTKFVKSVITGDFSNTATVSSELSGYVFVVPDSTGQHYNVSFRLLEYGNSPVTYSSGEESNITLKIKIADTVKEFTLYGTAPNGDLYLGIDDESDGDYFVDALYSGKNIRCIIVIGSSQYNFDVSSEGFCDTFEDTYEIHSMTDALKAFYSEKYSRAGTMYMIRHNENMTALTADRLAEILPGYWTSKDIESNSYASLCQFTEDGKEIFVGNIISGKLEKKSGNVKTYSFVDGTLSISDSKYEFYEISEGYYLVNYYSSWGVKYYYIYFKCDENAIALYTVE